MPRAKRLGSGSTSWGRSNTIQGGDIAEVPERILELYPAKFRVLKAPEPEPPKVEADEAKADSKPTKTKRKGKK